MDDKGSNSDDCSSNCAYYDSNCGYYIKAIFDGVDYPKGYYPAGQNTGTFHYEGHADADQIFIKFKNSCGKSSEWVNECIGEIPIITINPTTSVPGIVTVGGKIKIEDGYTLDKMSFTHSETSKWKNIYDTSDPNNWSYNWHIVNLDDGKYTITIMGIDDKGCSGDATCDIYIQDGQGI